MTFQGNKGAGDWQGTPVEKALPVEIQSVFDDPIERPEGAETTLFETEHLALQDFDRGSLPDIYGYDRTGPVKHDAELHATVDEGPLIVTGEYDEGRTFVYTSDPGIKWGVDHVEWDKYQRFWMQGLE